MARLEYGYPALGGKTALLSVLKPMLEGCADKYNLTGIMDLCGGGNKIIPNINPYKYKFRLYNELERGLSCLTACLCDEYLTRRLIIEIDKLFRRGNPREVFKEAFNLKDEPAMDILTSGAYTFYIIYSSFAANRKSYSEGSFDQKIVKSRLHLDLTKYNVVMEGVAVTHANCFDLLAKYSNREDFLGFLDVPYVNGSMNGKNHYINSWPDELHNKLIDTLIKEDMKMKWIVCGYKNDLYRKLEESGKCNRYFVGNVAVTSGASKGEVDRKEEYIWTNMSIGEYIDPVGVNDDLWEVA